MAIMALESDFDEIITELDHAYREHDLTKIEELETKLQQCVDDLDADFRANERQP